MVTVAVLISFRPSRDKPFLRTTVLGFATPGDYDSPLLSRNERGLPMSDTRVLVVEGCGSTSGRLVVRGFHQVALLHGWNVDRRQELATVAAVATYAHLDEKAPQRIRWVKRQASSDIPHISVLDVVIKSELNQGSKS